MNDRRLMAKVWLANLLIVAFAIGAFAVIKTMGFEFALGVLAASFVYNICHRVIYGRWF